MKPFLNNVSGKTKSDIIYLNGGLNTCFDQTEIRDNQLAHCWNVCLMRSPTLATRSNRTSIAWLMEDTTIFAQERALAMFVSSSKTLYVVEYKDTNESYVYRYKVGVSSFIEKSYVGTIEYSDRYSICECKDSTYTYIYISTPSKLYKYTEGNAMVEIQTYAGTIASHKNRLWIASNNIIRFSNLMQYDNFTIDPDDPINTAGEIQITNARGRIVGLIPFDGKLVVLCDRSWHVIYGSSPNPEVDQFYLVDMDDGVGCCSPKGFAICDRSLYWMDSDVSVYKYNGSSLIKVSEPFGKKEGYAQYSGIKDYEIQKLRLQEVCMASFDSYLYIGVTSSFIHGAVNDTFFVYDTQSRVWWLEDGAFSDIVRWDTDVNTPFFNRTDLLVGAKYNGDLQILNCMQRIGYDLEFNKETRGIDQVDIEYSFETKTWLLNSVKNKKTLTNVWWQADANADVFAFDNWTFHTPGQEDITFLPIGKLVKASSHNILTPTRYFHEGEERQRMIIPRMYLQRVNAFGLKVVGRGQGEFHLLEKEWRIK